MDKSVAIIGIACRFPGSNDIDEFWETLKNGQNHVTVIPEDRWKVGEFYYENIDVPGKAYTNTSGLIQGVYDWDNVAFDINMFEAERMHPHQKLALEVTFKALENAGLSDQDIKGSNTAVFIGQMNDDYAKLVSMDNHFTDNYTPTDSTSSILANRISCVFDLRGPSVTLDTALSPSLFGVHLAANSIVSGECNMAVCGDVNVMLSPGLYIGHSKARKASNRGQCQPFLAESDGYARGEGCGIVILKSARKALEDNNRIWGYVSTGCNSDGQLSIPISHPSGASQEALINQTFKEMKIPQSLVQYVEMHGTGTPVGDSVESSVVGKSIGKARQLMQYSPLKIGCMKSNIGNLDSAAGIAGLLKVVLMLHHGQYVPSLFSENLNPAINFKGLHLEAVKSLQNWPLVDGKKRTAALNSFGFGGTNIHAIVEQINRSNLNTRCNLPYLVVSFSGKSELSVLSSIKDSQEALEKGFITNVYDMAFTSCNIRNHYNYRKAIVTTPSTDHLKQQLQYLEKNTTAVTKVKANKNINTIFVFSGMGTHWNKMGMELYQTVPIFRETINKIDKEMFELSGFKIKECLDDGKDMASPCYGQPAVFAIQVGLLEMWRYFGIHPDIVIGHSVGEVAAAYASKSLTLKSAISVIYHRSNKVEKVKGGCMLVVGRIAVNEVEACISDSNLVSQVCVAAYNTPTFCTLAGNNDALDRLEQIIKLKFASNNIFLRKLGEIKAAYHSHYMDPVLREIKINLANLTSGKDVLPHVSTVTGNLENNEHFCSANYWVKNVRQAVLFDNTFQKTLQNNYQNLVIEIGPKLTLRNYIKEIGKGYNIKQFASMEENKCCDVFFKSLAQLYESGKTLQYSDDAKMIDYPRYGYDRKWLRSMPPKVNDYLVGKDWSRQFIHPFVTSETSDNSEVIVTNACIDNESVPFVFDHVVGGITIVPGSTYVEMVAASFYKHDPSIFSTGKSLSMEISFSKPCFVTSKQNIKTTFYEKQPQDRNNFREFDCTTMDRLYATGKVSMLCNTKATKCHDISSIKSRCPEVFYKKDLYSKLGSLNFSHGPLLQCVHSGQKNNVELIAKIAICDENYHTYIFHPVLLDCVLQLCVMFSSADNLGAAGQIILFGIEEVLLNRLLPVDVLVYVCVIKESPSMVLVNADILDVTGTVLAQCRGIKLGVIGSESNVNNETCNTNFTKEI